MHCYVLGSSLRGKSTSLINWRQLGSNPACPINNEIRTGIWCSWQHVGLWILSPRFEPWYPCTYFAGVVHAVRTSALHAEGRRFESFLLYKIIAGVAQLVEQRTFNPLVVSSILTAGIKK